MKVDGQCLCGYLSWDAEVDPESTGLCNCIDCQTLAGSAFRVTVQVTGAFKFLAGEPSHYTKVAESGNRRELAFCPKCGTSIYSRPADGTDGYFGLRVGALRQRNLLVPRVQWW